jgi:hypothetical protein
MREIRAKRRVNRDKRKTLPHLVTARAKKHLVLLSSIASTFVSKTDHPALSAGNYAVFVVY